jgi:hypothetical protein
MFESHVDNSDNQNSIPDREDPHSTDRSGEQAFRLAGSVMLFKNKMNTLTEKAELPQTIPAGWIKW